MRDPELYDLIARLTAAREPFAVATVVRTVASTAAKAGAKAVVTADGTLHGFIGGGCVTGAVKRTAAVTLQEGRAQLISVVPRDEFEAMAAGNGDERGVQLHRSNCPSGGTMDVFIEPMLPAPELIVCGSSPVAAAIADLGPHVGFSVTVVAPEAERSAFKAVERAVEAITELPGSPAERFVIVATQGKRDFDTLKTALETDIPFVAFIGSKRKAAALKARLAEARVAAAQIDRLRAPAGLWIGAITPEEIALSIVADVVRTRRLGARNVAHTAIGAGHAA